MREALGRKEFYPGLCSPTYCSAPQTWHTDAHRLMRDRHRRQILNRLAPPQQRRRQRGKDENNNILDHGEMAATKESSVVNDEQRRPVWLSVCLARVSKQVGSRTVKTAVQTLHATKSLLYSKSPRPKRFAFSTNVAPMRGSHLAANIQLSRCGCDVYHALLFV